MNWIIPYRLRVFETDLPQADIEARVRQYAHLGQWEGMFIKSKPYFGDLHQYGFEVRQTGHLKKYSMSPILVAQVHPQASGSEVSLSLKPHVVVAGLAVLFVGSCVYFFLVNVLWFFRTWDIRPAVTLLVCTAIMAAIFTLPFQVKAKRTLQFWINELRLRESAPPVENAS